MAAPLRAETKSAEEEGVDGGDELLLLVLSGLEPIEDAGAMLPIQLSGFRKRCGEETDPRLGIVPTYVIRVCYSYTFDTTFLRTHGHCDAFATPSVIPPSPERSFRTFMPLYKKLKPIDRRFHPSLLGQGKL